MEKKKTHSRNKNLLSHSMKKKKEEVYVEEIKKNKNEQEKMMSSYVNKIRDFN